MPYFCEPWVVREIVEQHMASPSMLAIIPIQVWSPRPGKGPVFSQNHNERLATQFTCSRLAQQPVRHSGLLRHTS
jgi:hypothetical protein